MRRNRIALIAVLILCLLAPIGERRAIAQDAVLPNIYLPLLARQLDPAWDWQPMQTFSLNPTPNINDSILMLIDSGGDPHLLYDTLHTPRYIFHTYPGLQGWITPTQVADTLGISYTLFPPVRDQQGTIHLLWQNYLGVGVANPYRLMYAAFSSGAWSAEEEVLRTGSEFQGMVRPDLSGGLRVTSASTLTFSSVYQFERSATGWSAPMLVDPGHMLLRIWPDYRGGVHFYGQSFYSLPNVYYSH